MKLRYRGSLRKTLVDVAVLEYGKVVEVTEELGRGLLAQYGHEYELVDDGRKKARTKKPPSSTSSDGGTEDGQAEVTVEVSGTDH